MPGAHVEAVVAPRRTPGLPSEVPEVAGCPRRLVLVVSGRRPRDRLHSSPGSVVGREIGRVGACVVLIVAQREHCRVAAGDEEARRRELAALARRPPTAVVRGARGVARDVARSRDHGEARARSSAARREQRENRREEEPRQHEACSAHAVGKAPQSKRQGSPAANDFRIRRATTMRCTSSGPS